MAEKTSPTSYRSSIETLHQITFRTPQVSDGMRMWRLATDCDDSGSLDVNSAYAYLLWCRDFAATSLVAYHEHTLIAFVTGYMRPNAQDSLFIWQIAVDKTYRRCGVAQRVLRELVTRVSRDASLSYVEATIMPRNAPSLRLFEAFARAHGALLDRLVLFTKQDFAGSGHDEEILIRIGPILKGNL